jgi:hypothetical protein
VQDGLKRLSGAKEVTQGGFVGGVMTFTVKYGEFPKVKLADVKKQVSYKVESMDLKGTTLGGSNKVGDLTLANPKDKDLVKEVVANKEKQLVLAGTLTEDDKGNQTLTLSSVTVAAK